MSRVERWNAAHISKVMNWLEKLICNSESISRTADFEDGFLGHFEGDFLPLVRLVVTFSHAFFCKSKFLGM